MKVKIRRQNGPDTPSFWQTFDFDYETECAGGLSRFTVASILESLNLRDELRDETGKLCRRIRWECSCLQIVCGGCAMVINGTPALACATYVDVKNEKKLVIEPLSKFPVLSDLLVDRSCIEEFQKAAGLYLSGKAKPDPAEYEHQYSVARCVKCGLCLEICPNFTGAEGSFFGAMMANQSYLIYSGSGKQQKEIKRSYQKHFADGCSKSLSCRDICPIHIPTLSSIAYMNRQ